MLGETGEIEVAGRLGLALCMAIFVGLAFEGIYKLDQRTSPGGIRSFPMLTTIGAALFLLQPGTLLPFAIGLAAVGLWQYAHLRNAPAEDERRTSLMIPAASVLAFTLGPVALTQPAWVVVAASVTAVLLIEGREALHRLVHEIAPAEVLTLGKFLILIGVILPLVPRHPVISGSPITPFQVWLALVATSTLSYASYLLQTYLPKRTGALLPAVLGGLYSSTVTTVALARQQRAAGAERRDFSVGILIATVIMYLRLGVILALFDGALALALLPAMAGLATLGGLMALFDWRHVRPAADAPPPALRSVNPLQLATALSFAVMFVIIAMLSNWVRTGFGQRGVLALAAITGATDIDPFVLSLAQGGVTGMTVPALAAAILIAASSNNALKALYAIGFGGLKACRRPALELLLLSAVGVVLALTYLR
jgi:uncharacterized membrane protein (DUF4010 family)